MDAMEFFQLSTGRWRSQRTTHHLAFKRSEKGESEIQIEVLTADDPKIIEICQLHEFDSSLAVGGAFVSWQGSMGWDREEENHTGSTVFALLPDTADGRQGTLLRERGYAEIVPVAGRYHMDEEDGLVLTTEYETMSSIERFWFASPSLRMRTSTVKRFGGFSTATFCTEFRIADVSEAASNADVAGLSNLNPEQIQKAIEPTKSFSFFGW
ncbi:chorismate-binding protein [Nostoc minutum NIES-26]|uniref:Chromophore lyase CpcS/CpeS n=1 Tax=Nostoc minutum NIES-26 TaxID=1844469 RepID=A0A367QSQ6_9NOSO|nr:phycobiliprotein lyase [Dendronalium sp. ChiSLP03b]MDZ8205714.1 phycobiliprotein lyase [Dendronalium sp. ChiSLP03b]RCJ27237.1 chorismate-binding protein [Nostoc minutum NIES-26]